MDGGCEDSGRSFNGEQTATVRSSHNTDFTWGSLMTSPGGHLLLLQRRVTCDFCCTCGFSNIRICHASQQKRLRSLVTFFEFSSGSYYEEHAPATVKSRNDITENENKSAFRQFRVQES